MENYTIIEVEHSDGVTREHVIVDKGNNERITILKSVWDEQQKAAELGGTL